jgi:hypothetical protein
MKPRTLVSGLVASAVCLSIAACVGDESTPTDAGGVDATDATTSTDSSTDAGMDVAQDAETFESGASCNTVDPMTAPAPATVTCTVGPSSFVGTGGTIPAGRYYLTEAKFYEPSTCAGIDTTTPFYDVAVFSQGDASSDYVIEVGLTQGTSHRFTLGWQVSGTMLTQSTSCPPTTNTFMGSYSVTTSGSGVVIGWHFVGVDYTVQSF